MSGVLVASGSRFLMFSFDLVLLGDVKRKEGRLVASGVRIYASSVASSRRVKRDTSSSSNGRTKVLKGDWPKSTREFHGKYVSALVLEKLLPLWPE